MNTRRAILAGLCGGAAASLCPGLLTAQVPGELAAPEAEPHSDAPSFGDSMTGDLSPAHDPCIIREGDVYHVFGSDALGAERDLHMPHKTSRDLVHWTDEGELFHGLPSWCAEAVPGTKAMWAPDISLLNGRYHIYYAVSTFGGNRSAIGLWTSPTLDRKAAGYGWRDEGLVFMSHEGDDYNCIDPCHVITPAGDRWLVFGSFWGGVQAVRLDRVTGKPGPHPQVINLARRPAPKRAPDAIEAPFIFQRDGWYYLFASYDYCCKGVNSSYYMVVSRARSITGPFVGPDGGRMLDGLGAMVIRGDMRWRGPGHNAVLHDNDGKDYLVYHTYDAAHEGRSTLRISPITWSADGWPTARL